MSSTSFECLRGIRKPFHLLSNQFEIIIIIHYQYSRNREVEINKQARKVLNHNLEGKNTV